MLCYLLTGFAISNFIDYPKICRLADLAFIIFQGSYSSDTSQFNADRVNNNTT